MKTEFPLPSRLNFFIAALQITALIALFAAANNVNSGWALAGIAIAYALLMNSTYAMLHEAEHGLLHENRRLNDTIGAILALFFPAPFHLLRQGHIGHHLRNRSDDEAFDFYFEGESRIWKTLQLYGILTGFFYLAVVFSNVLALIHPKLLKARWGEFDRPTRALLDSLNPRYFRLIRLEALGVFVLHGRLTYWAPQTCILDRGFLDIGHNVVMGAGVKLNPHVVEIEKLLLAPIKIGDRALVGGYSLLTAGTEIAPDETVRAFLISPPFSKWKDNKRIRETL